ncbi:MAG: hypothetical protein MEQ74_08460 [Paracoccus sp.]|nr:hypothetical protein [Paracoccus sp. (in: a-proteobacteria)]
MKTQDSERPDPTLQTERADEPGNRGTFKPLRTMRHHRQRQTDIEQMIEAKVEQALKMLRF